MDLLIFPSREFDSFPNVLLEAGFAGIPVVGAEVGGAVEIIRDGDTGWLFPPEDWAYAASRVSIAIESPNELVSMGNRARKRMRQAFTTNHMVANYVNLYHQVTQESEA